MKKILFQAVLLVLLFSCKKQTNIDAVTGENTIEEGQCIVNIKGQNMSVCFDGLEQDSRCPLDRMCFWQGVAVAKFKLTNAQTTTSFNLATFKFSNYVNDTTINNVHITLKNVTPYPGETGYNSKKKKAVLEIK